MAPKDILGLPQPLYTQLELGHISEWLWSWGKLHQGWARLGSVPAGSCQQGSVFPAVSFTPALT